MKKCMYCAEEIQDEAVVCRFCGRSLPSEVKLITDQGPRYAIGARSPEGFGIWDLRVGGPPVATFPWGDDEWQQAWGQYQRLSSGERARAESAPKSLIPGGPGITAAAGVILGGVLLIVGSLMPWITAQVGLASVSRSGVDRGGDGIGTLILGLITILIGIARLTRSDMVPFLQRSPILTGGIAAVLAGIDFADIQDRINGITSPLASAAVGAGLYIVFVGAAIAILGGIVLRSPRATETAPT